MKFLNVSFFALLSISVFSCTSEEEKTEETATSKIEFGDPGKKYDDVKVESLQDKVSYSVGYNSSEDAKQFLNSEKYHQFFNRMKVRDGFFDGINMADSVKAQEYNGLLMIYFENKGEFDTTNIKPAEASYYIGYLRGYELKRSLEIKNVFQDMSMDIIRKGYKDGLWDTKPVVPINEQQTIITEFFSGISKLEGQKFLDDNKKRKSVRATPSGLQYEIVEAGSGPKPSPNSRVTVYYTLRDISNRVLETNADQPEPITFGLNEVIPGWTEGLQLVSKGGKIKLFVPYELAYGEQGSPPKIQPYSTLIFEIELIDFK